MADDTTRGVHLNDKQLVFVLMAAGVICGVMFLFGVLVGRGAQPSRGAVSDGAMISAPQPVSDGQSAAEVAAAKPAGTGPEELSYPKRLSQAETPAEQLKSAPASPPDGGIRFAQPADAKGAPAAAAAPPEVADESVAIASPAPGAAPPAGAAAAKPVAPGAKSPAPAAKPSLPAGKTPAPAGNAVASAAKPPKTVKPTPSADAGTAAPWVVQIVVTRKKSEADSYVRRLRAKGYEAAVVVSEGGDRSTVYRVRVGSFAAKSDAEALARRIGAVGKNQPWVTR